MIVIVTDIIRNFVLNFKYQSYQTYDHEKIRSSSCGEIA